MSLKAGVLLALAYIVPFAILIPPESTDSPGAVFFWFLYPIVSGIVMLGAVIIAWKFLDVEFIPWGLLLIIGSPALSFLFSPIFGLMWGVYIVPTALAFVVGLVGGD
jgi:hypothetical protein